MATLARRNTPLGDLVVAAFDRAALLSSDPREVSRLAAKAITREMMKEWTAASARRRAARTGTQAAWTRLFFRCAAPPVGLLERAALTLGRGAVGGRASL